MYYVVSIILMEVVMARVFYDEDASLELIEKKVITILGYGNQGRSQALNMRDSGIKNIIIGSRRDESWDMAKEDGFPVHSIEDAVAQADIVFMLIPDEVAPSIYEELIEPNLKQYAAVNFASGYNVTYGYIKPRSDLDIIMVAPRMIGKAVRELYLSKEGFPSFVAVEQNASGQAHDITLALGKAIGSTRKGCIEVTFRDETCLDLMAEQATWPLVYAIFTEVFNYQLEMGHPEEAVLVELYLSKEPAVMMNKAVDVGFFKQLSFHSNTSQYGQLVGFNSAEKSHIREYIAACYERISSGKFAEEWKKEQEAGMPSFERLKKEVFEHPMNKAEERVVSRIRISQES
jgi:ketol-acid reductoisomerase